MAKFTIELGKLVGIEGFTVGLEEYPIFDETYRAPLNALITEHFFFREIGLETPALFKRFLNRKMAEIMPLYNELYRSQLLVFNPLYNTDVTTVGNQTGTQDDSSHGETVGNNEDNAKARIVLSNTPQTQLSGNEDYATQLTDSTSAASTAATGQQDGTAHVATLQDYTTHVAGYNFQNPSNAILSFRATLINVNLMVFAELEELFMGLWENEMGGF